MANELAIRIVARGASEAAREIGKIPAAATAAARGVTGSAKQSGAAIQGMQKPARDASGALDTMGKRGGAALKNVAASAKQTGGAATQLGQKLRQVGADGEAGFSQASGGAANFKGALAGVAATIAGMGLSRISSGLIETGLTAANAEKKLQAMLNVRGQGHLKAELIALSAEMQKLTGQSDETFTEAASHLLSFGLSVEQIKKILPGMSGQADTMGQSLVSVADGFGRAFASGQIGALARTGLVLSEADKEAVKLAKSTSEAAGQTELFNRVLQSYEQYAVKAGEGTDATAKKIRYFGEITGDAQEQIGLGAAEMRAAWMSALTPMIESLNENHKGVLKNIGAVIELGGALGQVAGPLTVGANLLFQYRQMTMLSTIASGRNTIAVTTEGNAAAASAAKFNILAAAKARAAGVSLAGLSGAAALGVGAVAVGATAYGAHQTNVGMRDVNMSDADLKEKHGLWGKLWAGGGKLLGGSLLGQMLEGGGVGHARRGDEAEKQAIALSAKMGGGATGVTSKVAGVQIGESTPDAKTGKSKKTKDGKTAEQRKVETALEKQAQHQQRTNAILAARSMDLGEVDIDDLNDRLALTTDAAEKAGLSELKRRATKYQQGMKAQAAAEGKDSKEANALQERIVKSEDAIAQAIIEERFSLASARLEAMKGKGNEKQIDYKLAQLEAQKIQELASIQSQYDDSYSEKAGKNIAGIKAQGILARAALAFGKGDAAGKAKPKARSPYEAFRSGANEITQDGMKFWGADPRTMGFGNMQPFGAANMKPLAGSGRAAHGPRVIELNQTAGDAVFSKDGQEIHIKLNGTTIKVPNASAISSRRRI